MSLCSCTSLCFSSTPLSKASCAAPRGDCCPTSPKFKEERQCIYCHKTGHVIANCLTLKEQLAPSNSGQTKDVGLVKKEPLMLPTESCSDADIDSCFNPFLSDGFV